MLRASLQLIPDADAHSVTVLQCYSEYLMLMVTMGTSVTMVT